MIDAENAGKPGAPQLHDEAPGNHCCTIAHKTEGFDEVFDAAPVKVSLTIDNQRLTPVPIEPRGVVADWITSSDELTFYTSTQVPHFVRTFVSAICGIPEAKVRVIAPDVGGGFGSKLNVYAEEFAIAQASRLTRAAGQVDRDALASRWSRRSTGATSCRRPRSPPTRDGRMLALRVHLLQDCGAYLQLLTPSIAHLTRVHGAGRLRPAARRHHARRGLHEHDADRRLPRRRPPRGDAPDRAARRRARRRARASTRPRCGGATSPREFPYTTATGLSYDSGDYGKALDRALELSDYAGFEARRAEAAARGNYRGIGLSTWVEICGLAPSAVTKAIGDRAPAAGSRRSCACTRPAR